ncbi:MAG TPA: hypothetical protein VL334_08855 [Anaerolineae bacterium]|nr:hypothetical protein [Anaerolineae bacterium]
MSEDVVVVEQVVVGGSAAAEVGCRLPAAPDGPLACPLCARVGTLNLVGDVWYCAACGYASDGVRGCT